MKMMGEIRVVSNCSAKRPMARLEIKNVWSEFEVRLVIKMTKRTTRLEECHDPRCFGRLGEKTDFYEREGDWTQTKYKGNQLQKHDTSLVRICEATMTLRAKDETRRAMQYLFSHVEPEALVLTQKDASVEKLITKSAGNGNNLELHLWLSPSSTSSQRVVFSFAR